MVRARGWTRYIGSKRRTYLVSIVLYLIPPVHMHKFSVQTRNEKSKVEREDVDKA